MQRVLRWGLRSRFPPPLPLLSWKERQASAAAASRSAPPKLQRNCKGTAPKVLTVTEPRHVVSDVCEKHAVVNATLLTYARPWHTIANPAVVEAGAYPMQSQNVISYEAIVWSHRYQWLIHPKWNMSDNSHANLLFGEWPRNHWQGTIIPSFVRSLQ